MIRQMGALITVVETSGVTEASSMIPKLDALPLRLESFVVVATADSDASTLHQGDLAVADVIILNKVDLLERKELVDEMEHAVATAAEGCVIQSCRGRCAHHQLPAVQEVKPEREALDACSEGASARQTYDTRCVR